MQEAATAGSTIATPDLVRPYATRLGDVARAWPARYALAALGIAAIAPPLGFIVRPSDLGRIAGVPLAIALTALLILAAALVALATALLGLERLRDNCRARGDGEHVQAGLRVIVAALAVAYAMATAIAVPDDARPAALIVASLGLAGGWILLLTALADPAASPLRRYLAMPLDALLISAFLHFGNALTAPWVLLYLLTTFQTGLSRGLVALSASAAVNLAGFGLVIATTAYWREQPLLAGGLLVALVALPACVARVVHQVAAFRDAAASAQAARTRFMMVVSGALRAPLDAVVAEGAVAGAPEARTAPPATRALLNQVGNVLDFAAIETGAFAPTTEPFDLHRVVQDALAEHLDEAAAKGLRLRCHIDPSLPYRLRGWPQQLAQIVDYLTARAIDVSAGGSVTVAVAVAGSDEGRVRISLTVRDRGEPLADPDAASLFDPFADRRGAGEGGAFGLAVVRRLVELMGGEIASSSSPEAGGEINLSLPLELDHPPVDSSLDLERCLVLIATEDSQFASEIGEPLNAWNADPRWIDGFDKTVGFVDRRDERACSVLIVDGRQHKLAALSFAHRVVTGDVPPSFVLFVADRAQIDGLMELAGDELDAVLPAPVNNQLFANALHALPLWHGAPARPVIVAPPQELPSPEPPPRFGYRESTALAPQVTPIATHPRFAAETPVVDPRAVAALRGLGSDEFLGEVLDSFRADAKEIMQRLVQAAAAADSAGFARGLHALRSCAANIGGTRLCDVLLSLCEIGADELTQQGSALVQRLSDELARLDASLAESADLHEARVNG